MRGVNRINSLTESIYTYICLLPSPRKVHLLHYDIFYHIFGTVHSVLLKLTEIVEKMFPSCLDYSKFFVVIVSPVYCNSNEWF